MYGEKIKAKRRELNLSPEDLADKLFITRQAISKWENDKATPTMTNLRELSEVFGVDMAYFIGESKVDEEEKEKDEAIEEKKKQGKNSRRGPLGHLHLCLPLWSGNFLFLSLLLPICRKLSGQRPKRHALSCPYNLHDCSPNSLPPSLQRYR